MKRIVWSILGGVVSCALAGGLTLLSLTYPGPPVPQEPAPAAAAAPSVAPAPVAVAEHDAKPANLEIVMPEVVIYGRVPRLTVPSPDQWPTPDRSLSNRLYVTPAGDYRLDGLQLSQPGPATPLYGQLAKSAVKPPRLLATPPALAAGGVSDEPRPPDLRFEGDPALPPAEVADEMQRRIGAFDVCYATAAREDPSLRGTADVGFDIGRDGHAERVDVKSTDLGRSPVVGCIRNVVSSLAFAPPRVPIHVQRPIELGPGLASAGA